MRVVLSSALVAVVVAAGCTVECRSNDDCGAGTFCPEAKNADGVALCIPAEGEGEGEGEDDDNGGRTRDEPEAAPSGCPFNASGSFPAFGALALVILGLRRRR